MEISNLLELSYYLAFLNYVLGAVLLGSPLPFASVKRLGYNMMKDSVAGFVLITSFYIILQLINFLRGLIGSNTNDFDSWFTTQSITISEKLVSLKLVLLASNPLLRSLIEPIVSVAASLLSTAFTSLFLLRIIYSLVMQKGSVLLSLGILLYTVPLGIFKRAGSLLISFVIISMIALPAIPNFVDFLASNIVNTSGSSTQTLELIAYPLIIVRDLSGNNLSYSYAKFYLASDSNNVIAAYPADVRGIIDCRSLNHGLPMEKNIFARVELYGWLFESSNSIYITRDCLERQCVLSLKISSIMTSDAPYIIIHTPYNIVAYNYSIHNVGDNTKQIMIYIVTSSNDEFYITFPATTKILLLDINDANTSYRVIEWSWNGVSGYTYVSRLNPGLNKIDILYNYTKPPQPTSEIVPYTSNNNATENTLENILSDVISILIISTFLPSIYVTLILMATNALSKILSARG
ncbi:MAG: hypothetical protein ACP5GI_02600 [Sulfolobales archaeon]